jgi:hypothetical protein
VILYCSIGSSSSDRSGGERTSRVVESRPGPGLQPTFKRCVAWRPALDCREHPPANPALGPAPDKPERSLPDGFGGAIRHTRAGRAKLMQELKTGRQGRTGSGMLLLAGVAAPHAVGPRPFPGNAPLRIESRPTHVSRLKQFHPTPQAPLPRCVTARWLQLGGSIQCHGDAADWAQPYFENCQVVDYGRLREGQYTARKITCQSVLGAAGPLQSRAPRAANPP